MDGNQIFIITGPPLHGKTTFAEMLCTALNSTAGPGNTSDVIYAELADRLGVSVRALRRIPKEDLRPALVDLGNELCDEDPGYLVRQLVRRHRVLTGVRRCMEYIESPDPKHMIWLEYEGGPKIEDNTEYGLKDLADQVFEFRKGDFEGMRRAAQAVVAE